MSSLLFGTSFLPPKPSLQKTGTRKKVANSVSPSLLLVISTRHNKNDSPCSGHNLPVQELKHRKGQSPHQPKSTKKVPVQDTASLFRSLNTDKDKAHTNPNQQRTSLFRTQPPFSGAQSSRKTVTHPPSLPPTASATKKLDLAQDTTSLFRRIVTKQPHSPTLPSNHSVLPINHESKRSTRDSHAQPTPSSFEQLRANTNINTLPKTHTLDKNGSLSSRCQNF